MKELRRILSKRRLLMGVVLILLLNGFLFAREQYENNFGLDLEISGGSLVFVDGSFISAQEPLDAKAAYKRYLSWLDKVKDMPPEQAAELLEKEKSSLSSKMGYETAAEDDRLDYAAVKNLLAQTEYLTGYGDWLENIQRNKENLLTFSIFNDSKSFSGRNIIKTADEFKKLENVNLTLGADGAINSILSFPLTDYFLTLLLILITLSFLEERKAGLWSVVHAAPNGRLKLVLRRTLILFLSSVCTVVLLYGTNLILGFYFYGGIDSLDRAVQSVEILGKLPMLSSVGGFLVKWFILRIAAAFLISLILWLMLTVINNVKYTIIVTAGILAAEYGLYTFLPVQSAFNIFKYFNLFTYISLSDLYTNYLNIDIFTYPLGIRSISQLSLIPLCLILAAICIYIHCRKKPSSGRDLLGKIAYRINSVTDKFLRRLNLLGMELHKTLWIQKGIVIIILLCFAAVKLSYTVKIPITSLADQAAAKYTAQFAGEITDSTFALINEEQNRLNDILTSYENAKAAYENGEIEYAELDKYNREASSAQVNAEGLSKVLDRIEELKNFSAKHGFTPWLIDETPFESVYGNRAQNNQQQAALLAVLALTLLLAGSMTYERQSGMTYLLKSAPKGRGALIFRKLTLAALMTTLVWSVVYGMELYTLITNFEITAWNASARNLSMLTEFPLNCPVSVWLVLLYIYRWLCLFCGAIIVLFISDLFRRQETAYITAAGVMLLPSLLYAYMGIEIFRPLSVILPVEAMPLLNARSGAVSDALIRVGSLAGIAVVIIIKFFVSTNGIKRRRF